MSKADGTFKVKEEDGLRLVYKVESHTTPQQYHTVDLLSRGGLGECTCPDSQIRVHVAIKAGADFYSNKSACKHVRVARNYFLKHLLQRMAETEAER